MTNLRPKKISFLNILYLSDIIIKLLLNYFLRDLYKLMSKILFLLIFITQQILNR